MTNWKKFAGLLLMPALAASVFVACGGDDDGGSGGGTGSDEEYVADICKGMNDFMEDFGAAFEDLDLESTNEDDMIDAFVKPFESLANAFEDAKPPSDLKDWHSDAVDALNDMVKAMKDGDAGALENDALGDIPDMPEDVAERLGKIAEDNEDCQASEELGGGFFGA
ncbi:MAG: hypothetical protein IT303_09005 [Dehalococcoidia bacterium]|nr:hypothetical protein [Dehalococcoidia bacterium]